MAGDWIKIEHTMPDKPEVVSIAAALGIDQDAVVGKLVRFWVWCDQQTVDGNALRVTPAFIDRLTACPGFAAALVEIGWLRSRDGRFSVPNFGRHNGQTAKSRALTSNRVKRARNGASVTEALPEKRREELRSNSSPPLAPSSDEPAAEDGGIPLRVQVLEVFGHYRTYHPRAFKSPTARTKEWGKILARFRDGYSVQDLKDAIDGNHRSPFHCGENKDGTRYNALELIVRDSSQVAKFLEIPQVGAEPVLSEKERRGQRAVKSWAARGSEAANHAS